MRRVGACGAATRADKRQPTDSDRVVARDVGPRETLLSAGNLSLRLAERRVAVGGEPVSLTYQEFELLTLLLRARHRVVRHRQIEQRLWHRTDTGLRNRTRVIVHRLRKKLTQLEPDRIEAVQNVGYRLSVPENPWGCKIPSGCPQARGARVSQSDGPQSATITMQSL